MLDSKLRALQEDNAQKLEKMRETVDEKLQNTLERRLGESFKVVSERLEQVHKDLGEMQTLAHGVGDLKRVLSNVKARGVLGEYQLGALLEQMLSPEQYSANVKPIPSSNLIVEYAVKLPGKERLGEQPVWLPIDAKFPLEDYHSLCVAYEQADADAVAHHSKALEARIRHFAKEVGAKYIQVPHTTDFAMLFLPFEGLYAEVLRVPGLFESLQREYKVNLVGPTTICAFLSSLQMGFRTLAIEKRSSEVWEVLGAVKTEFGKFGGILERTRKKLDEAVRVIDDADVRNRAIARKLRSVDELPAADSRRILGALDSRLEGESE
jgi:DNA recombination protein RmuC